MIAMVRFVLYSDDRELQRHLSLAVGAEVLLERTEVGAQQLLKSGACHACILHLGAAGQSMQNRMEAARNMIDAGMDVFVAADKGFEWSAMELVQSGARGYFRNDGEFRTLKDQLLRPRTEAKRVSGEHHVPECENGSVKGLIGMSAQMQNLSNMIRLVADLDVAVFIHGETGTGKEVIARAIHNQGCRADRPFVAVSCGAIPETLLEAELFGHEKGAFTGTVGARHGNLEEAADGTLFFDEIAELSLPAQVKLLRVLQECEFRRLGSNRLIPLRARLIFATHQDLEARIAQGCFRQDLYYRMDVVRISVPPLRNRLEDIPPLAAHFLKMYARKFGFPASEIDSETLERLQEHSWPGNVRELEHVIQSSVVLSRGEVIRPHHLPEKFWRASGNVVNIGGCASDDSFEEQVSNFKLKLAQSAVRQNHGNKTLAARTLNISRPYLHRLLHLGDEDLENELAIDDEYKAEVRTGTVLGAREAAPIA
jgi:DNA-binding NtrC family response regulator